MILVPSAASGKVTGTVRVRLRAVAAEDRVGGHVGDDVEVARRAAVATGTAPALEPDALAVVDAGRDAHLHLARTALDPAAVAGRARVGDDACPARRSWGRAS